ncbi:MAG TPA: hypothetical protein VM032_03595 [Vicinamibacterales bacterium]|nr:hypothetical protein [Vicinamibacterales bacterium]
MRRALGVLLCLLALPSLARAQNAVDAALSFYAEGGAYCFRIAPFGTALSEETEWTVMMLTSASNHRNSFRIRSVDAGNTGLSAAGLRAAGLLANDVWKFDGTRADFFERFAEGIRAGKLRARVVSAGPPNLPQVASERERAELYLQWADKGTRVSFDKVPDLTPEQFQQYAEYFPD